MAPLDPSILTRQHRRNQVESLLILAGIGAWMALVGWLVFGGQGIVWAALGTVAVLLLQPVRSTTLLKAMYGAMPLAPDEAPGLFAVIRELARRAGMERVPPLLYIPRPEMIALSTGWGRDCAIALSDGMLRTLPGRELAAVMAHETSHLRTRDLRLLRLAEAAGRLTRFVSLFGLLTIALYLPAATMMGASVPLLPLLLLVAAPMISDLMMLRLSRTREFAADSGAAELTGDPIALMNALRRIDALQDGGWERLLRTRAPKWLRLIRTHPTTEERLARLRELVPRPPPTWLAIPETLLMPRLLGMPLAQRGRWPRRY